MKGINLIGVKHFLETITLKPQYLLPHQSVKDIRDIPFKQLKQRGIKGVVFDKDNTLSITNTHQLFPPFVETIDKCKELFPEQVVIFSNTAGSSEDPHSELATEVEKQMGIPVLRHFTKKPRGKEALKAYFKCELNELVMIGDRYGTDVVFGNTEGMYTIRTMPFSSQNESHLNLIMQKIEQFLIQNWLQRYWKPPNHKFL